MIDSAAKEVLSKLGRIKQKNRVLEFENPHEIALQAHRFEWTLRFESLGGLGMMSITALEPERRAQNTERPPLGFEPPKWAERTVSEIAETGGRMLLAPSPFYTGRLSALGGFLENHAVQLIEEPWRTDIFSAAWFAPDSDMGFRVRASHSLGVVTPTEGCFEIEIQSLLSTNFDPLYVSVGGRVNISECAAFVKKLRAFDEACSAVRLACDVARFKQMYPGKRPSDLDKEQEERLRQWVREEIRKNGKLPQRWAWLKSFCRVWYKVRFPRSHLIRPYNSVQPWANSIIRSEMGEDIQVASLPINIDDAEFLGGGILPEVDLEPQPKKSGAMENGG